MQWSDLMLAGHLLQIQSFVVLSSISAQRLQNRVMTALQRVQATDTSGSREAERSEKSLFNLQL